MSALTFPNTFVAGTLILSAEMNANFLAGTNWADGGVGTDNFETFADALEWAIITDVYGVNIATSSTIGAIIAEGTGVLAAGKSIARFAAAGAQVLGAGVLDTELSGASSTIPVHNIANAGTGPGIKVTDTGNSSSQKNAVIDLVSTKKGAKLPRLTTSQRSAMTMHANDEGCEIYNTTLKRKEVWNGTFWVSNAGDSGRVVDWPGATVPPHMVDLSVTSLVTNVAPYEYIYSILGTTWGVAGTLPDTKGRGTIGDGAGSGLTARTLAGVVGAETLPAHTHAAGTLANGNQSASHTHSVTVNGAFTGVSINAGNSGAGAGPSLDGNYTNVNATITLGTAIIADPGHSHSTSVGTESANHTHAVSGSTASEGTGTHGVMQPSVVMKRCIVL